MTPDQIRENSQQCYLDGIAARRHAFLTAEREKARKHWKASKALGGVVVAWKAYRAATSALVAFEDSLDPRLREAIGKQIESPDLHPAIQAAARLPRADAGANPSTPAAAAAPSRWRLDEAEAIARNGVAGPR